MNTGTPYEPQHEPEIAPANDLSNHTTHTAVDLNEQSTVLHTSVLQAPTISTSRRPPYGRITLFVGIVFMLVGAGVWYSLLRIPDKEYDYTLSLIDNATKDAAKIKSIASILHDNESVRDINLDEFAESNKRISAYRDVLKQVQTSTAVRSDSTIKRVYDETRAVLEGYATNLANITDSLRTYTEFGMQWNECKQKLQADRSYDKAILATLAKECEEYFEDHPTVPSADFNTVIYVPLRAATLDALAQLQIVQSTPDGMPLPVASRTKAPESFNTLTSYISKARSYVFTYESPNEELASLQSVLEKRKGELLR